MSTLSANVDHSGVMRTNLRPDWSAYFGSPPMAIEGNVVPILPVDAGDHRPLAVARAMLGRHRFGGCSVTCAMPERGHKRIGDDAAAIIAGNSRSRPDAGCK